MENSDDGEVDWKVERNASMGVPMSIPYVVRYSLLAFEDNFDIAKGHRRTRG